MCRMGLWLPPLGGSDRRRDQVVVARAHDSSLDEVSGFEKAGVGIREDDDWIDLGRLPLQAALQDELMLGRGAIDEHSGDRAHLALLGARHDLLLPRHQRVTTLAFRPPRHVIRNPKRACPLLMRIREYSDVVELDVGNELLELGELFFRLTGEADDESGAERD